MRKYLFIFVLSSLFILSCNDSKKGKHGPKAFAGYEKVDTAVARSMILHYRDANVRRKVDSTTIEFISFNYWTLNDILSVNEKSNRVRIFTAAYVAGMSNPHAITVLVQVRSGEQGKYTYDYFDLRNPKSKDSQDDKLCPPPYNCDIAHEID